MADNKNSIVRKVIKSWQNLGANLKEPFSKETDDETNKIYNKLVDKNWLSTEKKSAASGWSPSKQAWYTIREMVKKARKR